MKTLKDILNDFEHKFGNFAIMGKIGRIYNGGFAVDVSIKEGQDFVKNAIKDALEAVRVKEYKCLGCNDTLNDYDILGEGVIECDKCYYKNHIGIKTWNANTTQYDENVKEFLGTNENTP